MTMECFNSLIFTLALCALFSVSQRDYIYIKRFLYSEWPQAFYFILLKATSYINDAIIDKQSLKYYGRYNWSMLFNEKSTSCLNVM